MSPASGKRTEWRRASLYFTMLSAVCLITFQILVQQARANAASFKGTCPRGCECRALSAYCRGDNRRWVEAVNSLPTDIEQFTFTIFTERARGKVHIHLNVHLERLQNLKEFRISTPAQDVDNDYGLLYTEQGGQIGPTVFCGLRRLKALHLNAKLLTTLNASAIVCLKKLEVLDLSYTKKMKEFEILPLMAGPLSREIATLLLRRFQTFGQREVQELHFSTFFAGLDILRVEVLDLAENAFTRIHPSVLLMVRLRKLDLSGNLLIQGDTPSRLTWFEMIIHPTLEEFIASHQELVYKYTSTAAKESLWDTIPYGIETNTDTGEILKFHPVSQINDLQNILSFWHRVDKNKSKILGVDSCAWKIEIPVGRNIRLANFSGFSKEASPFPNRLPERCLCFFPTNVVQQVDFSNNRLDQFLDVESVEHFRTSGLNELRTFDLRNNNLKIRLQSPLFSGLPSLRTLLLGGNQVQLLNNDSFLVPKTLGGLRELDLSRNLIETLPYLEFHFLSNMEVLDLSWNRLSEFDVKLPKSSAFKKLDISGNKLTYIGVNMTAQLEAYKHLQVDLLSNSFVCGCETLHFVRWIQTTPVNLTGRDNLYCFANLGQEYIMKLNFRQLYQGCNPLTLMQIVLISVSSTSFFFGLIISSIYVYRRRWKIRYFLYRRRLRRQRAEQELSDDYQYDAFVSFCDQNDFVSQWAQTKLEMELSDKRGLRLFVPQRDVLPCQRLPREIDAGMRKSRKVILILTPDYLTDWRCMYEAWEAHTTMLSEDRDTVVLVHLRPLPFSGLPGTLTGLMEMRQCLTWTDDCVGQELFWEKLTDILLSRSGSPIYD